MFCNDHFLLNMASFHNVFHFDSNLQKWVQNQNPEYYEPKDICDLATHFWIFEPKRKI